MPAPSLATLTSAEVKTAIKGILTTALASSLTKIYARRLQAIEDGEDLKTFVDDGIPSGPNARPPIVNSIMFWRESILPPPTAFSPLTGKNPVPFDPRHIEPMKGLRREVWTYRFKFYYQFDDGDETDNSTARFDAIVDGINAAFWAQPKLGLNSYRIDRHSQMFWPELPELQAGDGFVHVGNGLLSVFLHSAAQS